MTTDTDMQANSMAEDRRVEGSPLLDAVTKLGLASIGAVSLTLETAESLLHTLAQRGEMSERHARRALRKLQARRPRMPRPPRPVIAIGTENLASKADMAALEQQVAALSAQVQQLAKVTPPGIEHGS